MTRALRIAIAALCVASCDGGEDDTGGGGASNPPPDPTYTIGGSVTGLRGPELVLENNGGDPLTVGGNGSFQFGTPLALGARYSVAVRTQPTANPAETCVVTNGAGTVGRGAITSVTVACRAMTGRYVYALSAGSPWPTISGFSIDPITGALAETPGSPFALDGQQPPNDFYGDEAGKFLFAVGFGLRLGGVTLTRYVIDSTTGALTRVPGQTMFGPFARAFFHPNGRVMYLPDGRDLHMYAMDPTSGSLTGLPGSPYRFPEGRGVIGGVFGPGGTSVFVVSWQNSPVPLTFVSGFAVDATTGALAYRGVAGYEGYPGGITIHPGGRYAYATSIDQIVLIGIEDPAYVTAEVTASGLENGSGPLFDQSGQFVYVLDDNYRPPAPPGDSWVRGYRIRPNGTLTPLPGSPYSTRGTQAEYLTIDPTHRFLVAANRSGVAVLEIDPVTGELEHTPDSPFTPTVGTFPKVMFDPSGKFAYFGDRGTRSVSSYSFDSASGRFSFISSYPVAGSLQFTLLAGRQ